MIIAFLVGCTGAKPVYDYDARANFSQYKTYHYFDDVGEGLNELDVKRFTRAIDKHMNSIGLSKKEQPQFFINVISNKTEILPNNNLGVGVGGGGRNVGIGVSTGIPLGGKKFNERITIDFVDAGTNKLFWQSFIDVRVKERMKPTERVALVQEIIQKMLNGYPPTK
jgi:hypothetical protein